jgi:phosphatidylserine/phosphatidylglycerophosphate/cardiolipin synthase-like enzyme
MRKLLLRYVSFFVLFLNLSYTVVAVDLKESIEKARSLLCKQTEHISAAFFSPAREVKEVILGLIANEQEAIRIAAYRFTDPDVAKALSDAMARGVKVSIITDYSNFSDKKEKVSDLYHAGAITRYYARPFSIMHDKIFLFAKTFLPDRYW